MVENTKKNELDALRRQQQMMYDEHMPGGPPQFGEGGPDMNSGQANLYM